MTVSNTAMNLIHSSAICCSAMLLSLPLVSCVFANCFDNTGEAHSLSLDQGRVKALVQPLTSAKLLLALARPQGKLWLLGVKCYFTALCPGQKEIVTPSKLFSPSGMTSACRELVCCWMDCV